MQLNTVDLLETTVGGMCLAYRSHSGCIPISGKRLFVAYELNHMVAFADC